MLATKRVALTFDDGPNPPYTNQILTILKKANIKATFFVCGANVQKHPEIVKKITGDGHLVGNHTYHHKRLPTLIGLNFAEILKTQALIENLTGQKQKLFRPPYGVTPFWLKRKLKKAGFKTIPYKDYAQDWKDISIKKIVENVITNVRGGHIILLHDGRNIEEGADRSKTVEALPKIIKSLKSQGYQFVSPTNI